MDCTDFASLFFVTGVLNLSHSFDKTNAKLKPI